MVNDELWHKAVQYVQLHHEAIEGLATLLSSKVKAVSEEVRLKAEEIDKLPAIKERFARSL